MLFRYKLIIVIMERLELTLHLKKTRKGGCGQEKEGSTFSSCLTGRRERKQDRTAYTALSTIALQQGGEVHTGSD